MGDKFPKHIYHSIICIGALVAHQENDRWVVDVLGAPSVATRSEKELISSFVDRIAELKPQLVTFNGSSFDLPVLRYRAMVNGVSAPGLALRPYFNRYSEDAVDLCDVLSSFSSQGKATLHEMSRVMGLPGKPSGIHGGEVEKYYREGERSARSLDDRESDVCEHLSRLVALRIIQRPADDAAFQASEANLVDYVRSHAYRAAPPARCGGGDLPKSLARLRARGRSRRTRLPTVRSSERRFRQAPVSTKAYPISYFLNRSHTFEPTSGFRRSRRIDRAL